MCNNSCFACNIQNLVNQELVKVPDKNTPNVWQDTVPMGEYLSFNGDYDALSGQSGTVKYEAKADPAITLSITWNEKGFSATATTAHLSSNLRGPHAPLTNLLGKLLPA